jgi:hypothetical protein
MSTPVDIMTLAKYAVGALLVIAGVLLIYIGKVSEGLTVIALGLGLLGYTVGEQRGYKKGLEALKH